MQPIGKTAVSQAQSWQRLTSTLNDSRAKLAMTTKYAKLLIGCYRTGEANDPEVYTAAVIAILSDYPEDVMRSVVDPRVGLPSRTQWLPIPAEVKQACEDLHGPMRREAERDAAARRQLDGRDEIDRQRAADTAEHCEQVVAKAKAQLAERGMRIMATDGARTISSKPWTRYTDDQLRALYPQRQEQEA